MRIETNDDTQFKIACARIDVENKRKGKLKNNVGDNPYIYDCLWCGVAKGCLCKDLKGVDYTDGSYHRARLMTDCLVHDNSISPELITHT